jgi:hypothetical protein
MLRFMSLFSSPTEEEKRKVAAIKKIREKYPSMKVVGRGTVILSPNEVTSSPNFKANVARAEKLAKVG